ncbi:hypothetical protein ACHWQZ_G012160 [Mnemiopsis leidyi]
MDFDPFTSFVEERFDPSVHIPDAVNSSFTPLQEPQQPSTPDHQTYPPSFVSDPWLSNLPPATSTPQHRKPKCEDFPQISRFSLDRGQTEVYWESDIDLDKIFAPSLSPIRPQIDPYSTDPQPRSSARRPRRLFHSPPGCRVEPYPRLYTPDLSSAVSSECSPSHPACSPDLSCDQTCRSPHSFPTLSSSNVEDSVKLQHYVLDELKHLVRVLTPLEEQSH